MTTWSQTRAAKPFIVVAPLLTLRAPYPPLDEIQALGDPDARSARQAFVRLWLTEGIPFAFQSCPAIYEELRGWLAGRLGTHPKDITLLGSGRLGFSLGGAKTLGRPFGAHSDLDFSVVSTGLFARLGALFDDWSRDYENGAVKPRHETERRFWDGNLVFGRQNLPLGFFDADKIPTLSRYPLAQEIGQSLWVLVKKLEVTEMAPTASKASIRVYDGWENLIRRVSFNLYTALGRRGGAKTAQPLVNS